MTVKELAERLALRVWSKGGDMSREITSGYMGDMLSWVMGRAEPDSVWITIMSNQNVAAVAALADVSCVLLAEGAPPDPELLEKAEKQGIILLGGDKDAFSLACKIGALLGTTDEAVL